MLAIASAVALAVGCELIHLSYGHDAHGSHVDDDALRAVLEPVCVAAAVVVAVVLLVALAVASVRPAPRPAALANAAVWATIAALGVQASSAAFAGLPGGHAGAGALVAGTLGAVTGAVHHRAHHQPTYRSFNVVAMLLAAGCLASMSLTSTGEWWVRNFSTLGTSDDLAAACFNAALVLSGGAMAAMSGRLAHGLARTELGARRGAAAAVRALIAVIGLSLAGVGLVPIDADVVLHNVFASAAGAAFAALAAGSPWWVRRMPRSLVLTSRLALGVEVAAWVAYDRLGTVSLTVFEVVAFALVFVWLIALVVSTHPPVVPERIAAARAHLASHSAPLRTRPAFALGGPPSGMRAQLARST